MQLYHVTINGKQTDVAASTIKTAISRVLQAQRLDGSAHLTIEANLSNWGPVHTYSFIPAVEVDNSAQTYYLVDGRRWKPVGTGHFHRPVPDSRVNEVFINEAADLAAAVPEATHVLAVRANSRRNATTSRAIAVRSLPRVSA